VNPELAPATSMCINLVLDALEVAIWDRRRLFTTELIHHCCLWKGLDNVELVTLEWDDWHNHRRLHNICPDLTPAEYELIHYGQHLALTEAEFSIT
jgi:transposase InsO family protein